MCGIAGLFDLTGKAGDALPGMLDCISHRGPDDSGVWSGRDTGIWLGHRRLSIIDLSAAGHQPMVSASGRYVLTYNGEIYNHRDLRSELERSDKAPPWRGHSDTEVLLAAFDAWGIEAALARSNGMFALAVWDTHSRTLILARDRIGEKPLYFGWIGPVFAFASEMKALTRVPGWAARMSPEAISTFLGTGYVRGPQSAVKDIFRLPPGCILELTDRQLSRAQDWNSLSPMLRRYWDLRSSALTGLASKLTDREGAATMLHELLLDAVAIRMSADVPLGAFLSGGIDSSLVTALMQAQSGQPVQTFSIGFDEATHDEAPFARSVAEHLKTQHTEFYVTPQDALRLIPGLATTFDEPFADTSQIPTLLVAALARKQVTVALSGDGGDELFAGYTRYFAITRAARMLTLVPAPVRRFVAPVLSLAARTLFPLSPSHKGLPHRMGRLAERLAVTDIDAMRLSFIGGTGVSRLRHDTPTYDLRDCLPPPEMRDTLRRVMYGDQLDYLPDDILHKVDRATMLYSLEARVPLLDHRLVEFSWRLPHDMLTDRHTGKQILRQILEQYMPRQLFDRPKQGFAAPVDEWLRGPLRDWAEALLQFSSLRELPMLDASRINTLWQLHLKRKLDGGISLWNVLMLADWRRRFQGTL